MNNIPFELMSGIAQNLNLHDAKNMYLSFTNGKYLTDKELQSVTDSRIPALSERIDPRIYLRGLTLYPQELLHLMEKYTCIIAGRCVLPFFFPNLNLPEDRWRIACPNEKWNEFMKDSIHLGMVWRRSTRRQLEHRRSCKYLPDAVVYIGFSRNYKGKYVTVEIVDMYSETPLHVVVRSPTTITQCFISSSFACHMYYSEIAEGASTVWMKNIEYSIPYELEIKDSCKSCKLLDNPGYSDRMYIRSNLFTTRYKMCINEYPRELWRDTVLKVISSVPESSVRSIFHGSDAEEVADMYTTECICGYDDGTATIRENKKSGIKLREYTLDYVNNRTLTDDKSYMYKFDATKDNTFKHISMVSWCESWKYIDIF